MQANEPTPDQTTAAAQPSETVVPVADGSAADAAPSLEEAVQQVQMKADEYHDAWPRAKAESENVRRRAQEDIAKAARFAIDRFARELLAVKDSLEAALASEMPALTVCAREPNSPLGNWSLLSRNLH